MRPALVFAALVFYLQCAAQPSSAIYQRLQPMPNNNSGVLEGKYSVFENREKNAGRKIELNVIVIPALHRDSTRCAIFFFEGGPGVGAGGNTALFEDSSLPYRKYHDIVLVDIRGTGKSNPLNCPSLQIKKNLQEQFDDMYPPQAVKSCYDELSKIADLTQYTTTNVVRDLEDVRKWLGYGKINIFGLSYGTRVALVYMKMFPRSVASCILWSAIPTYGKMPLYHARFAQESLQKIFNDCKHDPLCHQNFPGIETEFDSLVQKFNKSGWQYQDKSDNIFIPWNAFQTKLRSMMYSPEEIREIPYLIHQTYLGNLQAFVSLYPKQADTVDFLAEGLYLSITCSEDVPYIQPKDIGPYTNGTFMGTYRIAQQKNACSLWSRGKIPVDYFVPVKSNIPTLIFSGGFDPVTPTSLAKEIASHLPRSRIILIPNMSHTFEGLSHIECFDDICMQFIDHPNKIIPHPKCIEQMKPKEYKIR